MRETDVRRDAFEVLERMLGGDVGQEENAPGAKKSAVIEREAGSSRGVRCRFGGAIEESAKGLEKKAAVLERYVADWGVDANGEPKNALVLELEEESECVTDEIEAGEYE